MPIDRRARRAARRLQPGVVETGDDEGVEAFGRAFDDFLEQARRGKRLVEIALDRGRADRRD